ncbi:MAG: hypothetical protein HRT87_04120 [Legionellales bacterium]|nr:hypothetical protein [Legionellales bacterium]
MCEGRLIMQDSIRHQGETHISYVACEMLKHGAIIGDCISFVEKPLYLAALRHAKGNQVKAAKLIGVARQTFRKRIFFYFGSTKPNLEFYDMRKYSD